MTLRDGSAGVSGGRSTEVRETRFGKLMGEDLGSRSTELEGAIEEAFRAAIENNEIDRARSGVLRQC